MLLHFKNPFHPISDVQVVFVQAIHTLSKVAQFVEDVVVDIEAISTSADRSMPHFCARE